MKGGVCRPSFVLLLLGKLCRKFVIINIYCHLLLQVAAIHDIVILMRKKQFARNKMKYMEGRWM
jgi:hypothetical protein